MTKIPLSEIARHFASFQATPHLKDYLFAVLRLCPPGTRSFEVTIDQGFGAIWLSKRGIAAEGIDQAAATVQRARQINGILGGATRFVHGDASNYLSCQEQAGISYQVIHHHGVLSRMAVPWIRSALARQLLSAQWVVFSVPSVYAQDPEHDDQRLLPIEEWQRILAPFEIEELKYYSEHQERDSILCTLRGRAGYEALRTLITVPEKPYAPGISGIVHTRNEARHIAACLESLQPWTDELIVCDMESEDVTVEIARRYTQEIVAHPRVANFDRARNVSAMRAKYRIMRLFA